MGGVTLIVVGLAVFRVTRLLVVDSITDPIRDFFAQWTFTDELLACPWCAGFWVGVGATIVYAVNPDVAFWLSLPFAFSAVAGLLSFD